MKKLIHDFHWLLVQKLNVAVWALTPEPERSDLRQIWRTQFDDFKKKNDGAGLKEMVLRQAEHSSELGRLAAEWDRQQNYRPSVEEARDLAERQRNVTRWPK